MPYIDEIPSRGHEHLSIFQNNSLGIVALIAVHNTTLGPSLGGCRLRDYSSVDEAVSDVTKLSQAMTWKNSLGGINFGGGKSVIIVDRDISKGRAELFQWFGDCVESLRGSYITAEDMGTTVSDIEIISSRTNHVAGRDPKLGGAGDPSPYTALGVFSGIRACLKHRFGSDDPSGRHVAIQGVGSVGMELCSLLVEAGANLTVADTREKFVSQATQMNLVNAVAVEEILTVDCDVLAPCAIGGIITEEVCGHLRCEIIAGGANNQLSDGAEELLREKGITYAPDFAINAGGVIMCADEFEEGGFQAERVRSRALNIYSTIEDILSLADSSKRLSAEVAIELAEKRIAEASSLSIKAQV